MGKASLECRQLKRNKLGIMRFRTKALGSLDLKRIVSQTRKTRTNTKRGAVGPESEEMVGCKIWNRGEWEHVTSRTRGVYREEV